MKPRPNANLRPRWTQGQSLQRRIWAGVGATVLILAGIFAVLDINSVSNRGVLQPYPAGIADEIQFWLKADAGVLHAAAPATDGQEVDEWLDQSGVRTNHAMIGSVNATQFPTFTPEGPTYRNNANDNINYHPVLEFDGVNDGLDFGNDFIYSTGTGNQDGLSVLVVAKADQTTSKSQQYLFDFGRRLDNDPNLGSIAGIYGDDAVQILSPSLSDATTDATSFFSQTDNTDATVVRYVFDFNPTRQEVSLNSNKFDFFFVNNTTTQLTASEIEKASFHQKNRGPFSIGRQSRQKYLSNNGGRLFQGKIAEIMAYSRNLNMDAWNIESYLMIKYGITMRTSSTHQPNVGDYLSSQNDRIWNSEAADFAYRYHIIGIGRDDTTELYQKQSHTPDDSFRVYLGAIAATNADNPSTITNDVSYIVIGDNEAAMSDVGSTEMPAGLFSRLDREWKITNTNFSDTFNWDITLDAEAQNGGVDANDLRVLLSTDGEFSNATMYATGDSGLSITYVSGVVSIRGITSSLVPINTTTYLNVGSSSSNTPLSQGSFFPVEWLDFTAEVVGNQVILEWQTGSEVNSDYFDVEKSINGIDWQKLHEVQGAGNSRSVASYRTTDPAPGMGTSYYRLKQVDFDGGFSYSNIRSVSLSQPEEALRIFPNPANRETGIQVRIPAYDDWIQLTITNIQGQEVLSLTGIQETLNQDLNRALPNIPGDYYIFQIRTEDQSWVRKVKINQ